LLRSNKPPSSHLSLFPCTDGFGVPKVDYIYAGTRAVAKEEFDTNGNPVKKTFFHADHLGSSRSITDLETTEIWDRTYLPYGETLTGTGTDSNTHQYTGKEIDEMTGAYYYGARYYRPDLGRFMSVDPAGIDITNPQSWNRYAYVQNNPYTFVDPDGEAVVLAAVAIAGGLILLNPDTIGEKARSGFDFAKIATLEAVAGFGVGKAVGFVGRKVSGAIINRSQRLRKFFKTGAEDAPIEFTKPGEEFVRVGKRPENLKVTFKNPGGTQGGTFAFPKKTFEKIGRDPKKLKNLGDLPGGEPAVFRTIKPPANTKIKRGIVPGGKFGGKGGADEVLFPDEF